MKQRKMREIQRERNERFKYVISRLTICRDGRWV